MGLKISTKIDNFDYPDSERIILMYGTHQVDVRPYIMSFLLRCTMDEEPMEIDYFISKVIEMVDECIHKHSSELPSMAELCEFRAKLTSELVRKIIEIFGDKHILS